MINKVISSRLVKEFNLLKTKKKTFIFINPFSYFKLRKEGVLSLFDGIFIDGISLIICLRLLGVRVERKSFDMTSIGKEILGLCNNNHKDVYFVGAKENEISKFVETILKKYPNLNIAGYRNGYFNTKQDEKKEILKIVSEINPSIIVIGMGSPTQELFLLKLKEAGYKGYCFTCGGFFHQTTKRPYYYPKWINTLNLRWLYRIYDEPKLFSRYLFYYPVGILLFIFDILKKQK